MTGPCLRGSSQSMALDPLNSRSADIPLVSASSPIRIDCSAASLFHGQVIAGGSSSLTLMMLRIDLRQLSVLRRWFRVLVRRASSWCWLLIRDRKNRQNMSLILNMFHEVKPSFFVGFCTASWNCMCLIFSYVCPSLSHSQVSFTFTFPSAGRTPPIRDWSGSRFLLVKRTFFTPIVVCLGLWDWQLARDTLECINWLK